jgi:hypothetical protein
MEDVIPPVLLVSVEDRKEVAPRRQEMLFPRKGGPLASKSDPDKA